MKQFIQTLKDYIKNNPPEFGEGNAQSIMDMLFVQYVDFNPIENEVTRQSYSDLDAYLRELPLKQADKVFDFISDICWELQKQAFSAGIRVGTRLQDELQ